MASSCASCAGEIGTPPEYAPGRHMAIIHDHHVPELVALGWIVTRYPHQPPDVACLHYHLAHWEGGHDGCCGMG